MLHYWAHKKRKTRIIRQRRKAGWTPKQRKNKQTKGGQGLPTWSKKTTINKINKAFETHGHMLHTKTKLKGCSSFSTKKTKSSRHGNDEKNLAGGATGEWPTLASATPATFTLQLGIQAAPVNFSFLVSKIHHQATTTTVIKKKKIGFCHFASGIRAWNLVAIRKTPGTWA